MKVQFLSFGDAEQRFQVCFFLDSDRGLLKGFKQKLSFLQVPDGGLDIRGIFREEFVQKKNVVLISNADISKNNNQ